MNLDNVFISPNMKEEDKLPVSYKLQQYFTSSGMCATGQTPQGITGNMGNMTGLGPTENELSQFLGISTFIPHEMTEQDKLSVYKYFYFYNPMVGTAIDIHTEIPLSRIKLNPPNIENDPELSSYIQFFYTKQVDRIRLFTRLIEIAHEYWLNGRAVIIAEFDHDAKMWSNLYTISLQYCEIKRDENTKTNKVFLKTKDPYVQSLFKSMVDQGKMDEEAYRNILGNNLVELPSDPYAGSFAYVLIRKPSSSYNDSVSIIDRVMWSLIHTEYLRSAQLAVARRSLKNKQLITAENVDETELDNLRWQIMMSELSVDFPIITSYPVTWEIIGVDGKMLPLTDEFEHNEDLICGGLGLTKGLLQGESLYSSEHITLEIINTRYALFREVIQDFVEEYIFKPIAYHNAFFMRLKEIDVSDVQKRLFLAYKDIYPIDVDNEEAALSLLSDDVVKEFKEARDAGVKVTEEVAEEYKKERDKKSIVESTSSAITPTSSFSKEGKFVSSFVGNSTKEDLYKMYLDRYGKEYNYDEVLDEDAYVSSNNIKHYLLRDFSVIETGSSVKFNKMLYKDAKLINTLDIDKVFYASKKLFDNATLNYMKDYSRKSVGYGLTTVPSITTGGKYYSSIVKDANKDDVKVFNPHDSRIVWFIPGLVFRRVSISDPDEAFTQLYNLYDRGAVPIDVLLDMFNLDSDMLEYMLKKNIFTLKDPLIAEFFRNFYNNLAGIGEGDSAQSNIMKKIFVEKLGILSEVQLKEFLDSFEAPAEGEEEPSSGF